MIISGWLVVLLTGVLPVAFWPGSTSYHALKWTLWGTCAGASLFLVARAGWRDRRWSLPVPRYLVLACATLLGALLVSTAGADVPRLSLRAVVEAACWSATTVTIAAVARDPRVARRLMLTLVVGLVPVGLYGIGQMLGIPGIPVPDDSNLPGISTLGNQNYLAGLMAIGLWPSVALWSGRRRPLAILATLILATALALANAVAPIFATAVAGVMVACGLVLIRRGQAPRVVWLQVAILVGALAVTAAGSLALVDGILRGSTGRLPAIQRLADGNSGDARLTNWAVAVDMAGQEPVLGVGPEHYRLRWMDSRARLPERYPALRWAENRPRATHAHDEYLQWVSETGLVGAVALIVMAGCLFVGGRTRWSVPLPEADHRLDLLLDAGVVTALLHALVSFPLHLPASIGVLAVLVGMAAARTPLAHGAISVPTGWWSRPLSLVAAVLGLVLVVGAWREFSADLLLARGQRQLEMGESATRTLQAGVERAVWPSQALYARAMAEFADGDPVAGEVWLRASVREQPTFEAHLQLAELALVDGDLPDAGARLAWIESCGPTVRHQLRTALLQGRVALARRRLDVAAERFASAADLDPMYYPAQLGLGSVAAWRGDVEEAERAYRRAAVIIVEELRVETMPAERQRLEDHLAIARRAVASTRSGP